MPDPSTPAGLYPPLPQGYESSYIGSPASAYGGQFLNPNASSFPTSSAGTGASTDFDDEPPLLEGMSLYIKLFRREAYFQIINYAIYFQN